MGRSLKDELIMLMIVFSLAFFVMYAKADETTINYKGMPTPSAYSPSISAYGSDMCRAGVSGGANTGVLSISGGATIVDSNCEMLRRARLLNDLGLKVAAVSLLCQTPEIFEAMLDSGSACPIYGSIGNAAIRAWYDLKPEVFHKKYGKNWTPPTVTTGVNLE